MEVVNDGETSPVSIQVLGNEGFWGFREEDSFKDGTKEEDTEDKEDEEAEAKSYFVLCGVL